MPLTLVINGQNRTFGNLPSPIMLARVIGEMELKGDCIAVEHNGEIAQRTRWAEIPVSTGDRLEVVHFVGGGRYDGDCAERSGGGCQLGQAGVDMTGSSVLLAENGQAEKRIRGDLGAVRLGRGDYT